MMQNCMVIQTAQMKQKCISHYNSAHVSQPNMRGAVSKTVAQATASMQLQGLEGREGIALVVDDTSSVWENHEENLFAVERYIYFPASRRQFNSKSKSLLEQRRDETPGTGMLMTALNVLCRTHARFFRALAAAGGVERAGYQAHGVRPLWDVREVLTEERRQVHTPVVCVSCTPLLSTKDLITTFLPASTLKTPSACMTQSHF